MNSIHFIKTHRLAGFAALLGLLFLSSACSKDSGDTSGDPSTTTGLKISLGGISEGGVESLEKSALEPETVTQKLDSDMTVEYTLAPTAASLARSTTAMSPGMKYRVLVYTSSGTYVGHQDYTAGSESSTPAIPVSAGAYKVVAYSYNTPDAIADDATAASLSVDTSKDLLYYSSTVNVVDGTSNPVAITFTHWFSKVTVVVSASTLGANITSISGVTLSPTYASASVALFSGATSSGSISWQPVYISAGGQTLTATTLPVFAETETSSFSVDITSLMLGTSTTYNGLSVSFSKTLVAGYTYTLTANLKNNFIVGGVRWAKGNLYRQASIQGTWGVQQYYSSDYTKGDYWNWKTTSPSTDYSSYNSASTGWITNDPCNQILTGTWRLPTYTDQVNLVNSGSYWTTKNSVNGRYFKISSAPTANSNEYLFLPAAGYRGPYVTSIVEAGTRGLYWTSTSGSDTQAYGVDFNSVSISVWSPGHYTFHGFPIRCVQDL